MDEIVSRTLISVPLLFIGVLMAIDPGGFLNLIRGLTVALQSFKQRLGGMDWPQTLAPVSEENSPRSKILLRCLGAAVAAGAVLPFVLGG